MATKPTAKKTFSKSNKGDKESPLHARSTARSGRCSNDGIRGFANDNAAASVQSAAA